MDAITFALADRAVAVAREKAERWKQKASPGFARARVRTATLDGDKVLVGGSNASVYEAFHAFQRYDTITDTWTARQPLSSVLPSVVQSLARLNGTQALALGLNSNDRYYGAATFDDVTNTWTKRQDRPYEGHDIPMATLSGNRVMIAGGINSYGGSAVDTRIYVWDAATNTWSYRTGMSEAKHSMGVAPISGDRVLICGGSLSSGYSKKTELYDHTANSITQRAELPHQVPYGCAVQLSDTTIAMWAMTYDPATYRRTPLMLRYNFTTNTWTYMEDQAKTNYPGLAPLSNGRILAVGGVPLDNDYGFLDATYLYDEVNPALIALLDTIKAWAAAS